MDVEQLFLERVRLGLRLVNAGIAAVFVGWIVVNPGELPLLSVIQACNFAAVAVALRLLRDPQRPTRNRVVSLAAYAVTIFATGGVGIVAGDGTTPLLILVGMAVIGAVLVPWQPAWHLTGMALTVVAASWTVAMVTPAASLFWLRNAGAIAPTLIAAVYLSRLLSRQRAAAEQAARERARREERLREANARLEWEVDEHRRTEAALRVAVRELDHRVKNTLAVVQSLTEQTLRTATSMADFGEAFRGRIQALARLHGALAERRWEGLRLGDLVELIVAPQRQRGGVDVDCDGAIVPAELARTLGLALHELATNAARFGALSTADGRVAVSARRTDDGRRLRIDWREHGGPPVAPPARRGFGMRLIEESLAYEGAARVRLDFPTDGLRCHIDLPMGGRS